MYKHITFAISSLFNYTPWKSALFYRLICYWQDMTQFNQSTSVLHCHSSSCKLSIHAPLICPSFALGWILHHKAALSIPLMTLTSVVTMNCEQDTSSHVARLFPATSIMWQQNPRILISVSKKSRCLRIQFLILITVKLKLGSWPGGPRFSNFSTV